MRWVLRIVGVILVLFGALWTLQGLNLMGQSGGMNGVKAFAVIGPIVAIVGLILIILGFRSRAKTAA